MPQQFDATAPTASFLIRVWPEPGSVTGWRGSVQHVQSGESAYFADARKLLLFIATHGPARFFEEEEVRREEDTKENPSPRIKNPKERRITTMAATLDELLNLNGVVAAGEFTADGKLVNFKAKMDMPPEMAAMTAQFCASVTMLFNTLAGAFSQLSKMNWIPQQGWMYAGGDWTVATGGTRGVFVETAKADFNQLFQALVGGR